MFVIETARSWLASSSSRVPSPVVKRRDPNKISRTQEKTLGQIKDRLDQWLPKVKELELMNISLQQKLTAMEEMNNGASASPASGVKPRAPSSLSPTKISRTQKKKTQKMKQKLKQKLKQKMKQQLKQKSLEVAAFLVRSIEQKKAELNCHVCLEMAAAPIFMCQQQHLICSNCQPRVTSCPECREDYQGPPRTPRRHKYAERDADELKKLQEELAKITK